MDPMITEQRRAEIREAALTAGPAGLAAIADLLVENHELRQANAMLAGALERAVDTGEVAPDQEALAEAFNRGEAAAWNRHLPNWVRTPNPYSASPDSFAWLGMDR